MAIQVTSLSRSARTSLASARLIFSFERYGVSVSIAVSEDALHTVENKGAPHQLQILRGAWIYAQISVDVIRAVFRESA